LVFRFSIKEIALSQWLLNISWTSDLSTQCQTFYNTASRLTASGRAGYYNTSFLVRLPTYRDLSIVECENQQNNNSVSVTVNTGTTTIVISDVNSTVITINTTFIVTVIRTIIMITSNNLVIHQATCFLLLFISSLTNEIII